MARPGQKMLVLWVVHLPKNVHFVQYLLFDARASVYITLINREIILKAEHDWLSILIGSGSNNLTQNFELRLLKFLL